MSQFQHFALGPEPPIGLVSLIPDKSCPVSMLDEEVISIYNNKLIVTRGFCDVSQIKQKIRNLPKEAWGKGEDYGNVDLVRPSHDQWGITKIIFTFCDDFLLKVLDCPFSQQAEWQSLLYPIFEQLKVDKSKVVRCLLAKMAPNMTIPVHHDTGYWVKYTHRVHVPIESGPGVEFLVGPTEDSMKRYLLEEGRIIELNNQAKHAVYNGWDRDRIHLIFDYVEDHPINRILLQVHLSYSLRFSIYIN